MAFMTAALLTVEQRPGITPPARESFDTMTIDNSNEKRRAYHYGRRETHLKHYLFTKTITMNSLCVFDDSLFS